jgi:hypothetical protein
MEFATISTAEIATSKSGNGLPMKVPLPGAAGFSDGLPMKVPLPTATFLEKPPGNFCPTRASYQEEKATYHAYGKPFASSLQDSTVVARDQPSDVTRSRIKKRGSKLKRNNSDASTGCSSDAASTEISDFEQEACKFQQVRNKLQTTVFIQNLSDSCTRQKLVNFLNENGFRSKYDMVYFTAMCAYQVAFVSFVSEAAALEFKARCSSLPAGFFVDGPGSHVSWASEVKGLQEAGQKFESSPVMYADVPEGCKWQCLVHMLACELKGKL